MNNQATSDLHYYIKNTGRVLHLSCRIIFIRAAQNDSRFRVWASHLISWFLSKFYLFLRYNNNYSAVAVSKKE